VFPAGLRRIRRDRRGHGEHRMAIQTGSGINGPTDHLYAQRRQYVSVLSGLGGGTSAKRETEGKVLPGGSVWTFALMPIESREDNPGRVAARLCAACAGAGRVQAGADQERLRRRMHGTALVPRPAHDRSGGRARSAQIRAISASASSLGVEGERTPCRPGRAAQAR